jgi:hypothetical protein
MFKYLKSSLSIIVLILLVSSCAPEGYTSDEYGFFSGIWHGICLPFAIIGKIFGSDIGIYAENNSGFLYWIGFIIGLGGLGGGAYRR